MEMVGKVSAPKKSISIFLIFLLMIIPMYSSLAIAKVDFGQGVIVNADEENPFNVMITGFVVNDTNDTSDVPDVGGKCSEKSGDVNMLVGAMDNEVVATLEKVLSIMYLLCTTMTAINSIMDAIYMGMVCCVPVWYNAAACAGIEPESRAWSIPYSTIIKPLCCLVQCGWCSGDDDAAGGGCFEIVGEVLSGMSLLKNTPGIVNVPKKGGEVGGTQEAGAGIAQFHMSPYDNIYTALGCMCPGAILFNMRKLKTIYQTYDCCIEESCENGLSTDSCDRQLSEATCMYWEGSLYKSLVKVLLSYLTGIIFKHIAAIFLKDSLLQVGLYCGLAVWNIAHIPETIEGVKAAYEWTTVTFKEPSCSDLGFDELKESQESGFGSAEAGTNRLALHDADGDGVYDSVSRNYDVKKMSDEDKNALGSRFKDYKDGNVYKYTLRDEAGVESVHYKVEGEKSDFIVDGSGKAEYELKVKSNKAEWNKLKTSSVAAPVLKIEASSAKEQLGGEVSLEELAKRADEWLDGESETTYNTINYDGENQAYEIGTLGLDLIDSSGVKTTVSFSELVGKDVELGGVNLKDSTSYNGAEFIFENGDKLWMNNNKKGGYNYFSVEDSDNYRSIYQFEDGGTIKIINKVIGDKTVYETIGIDIEGIEFEMKDSDAFQETDLKIFRDSVAFANKGGVFSDVTNVEFTQDILSWESEGQNYKAISISGETNEGKSNSEKYTLVRIKGGTVEGDMYIGGHDDVDAYFLENGDVISASALYEGEEFAGQAINVNGVEFTLSAKSSSVLSDLTEFNDRAKILGSLDSQAFSSETVVDFSSGNLKWTASDGREYSIDHSRMQSLDGKPIYEVVEIEIVVNEVGSEEEKRAVTYITEDVNGEMKTYAKAKGENTLPLTSDEVKLLPYVLKSHDILGDDYTNYEIEQTEDGLMYSSPDKTKELLVKNNGDTVFITDVISDGVKVGESIVETTEKQITTSIDGYSDGKLTGYTNTEIKNRKTGLIETRFIKTVSVIGQDPSSDVMIIDYGDDIEVSIFVLVKDNPEERTYIYKNGKLVLKGDHPVTAADATSILGEKRAELLRKTTEEDIKKNKEIKEDKDVESVDEIKEIVPEARVISEQNEKDHLAQASYELTWELLNSVLGSYAYGYIDGMCKEDEPEDRAAEGDGEDNSTETN